ncbi:hypothetical protein EU383_21865 [Salmonella enterica subsp. enterica serovar Napoli]|nr:hypothetical protein [Salmonella enterica subsp. enterica serovar Napoli]
MLRSLVVCSGLLCCGSQWPDEISGDDGPKGCLGDSGCVKQVAEMRPFLLDGITGVKKLSYKPINLLKFLFILGRIPLLCDRFLFANNGKAQKAATFWAHKNTG